MSNTDSTKNTTQKTKKMRNTDPTKNTKQKTKKMINIDPVLYFLVGSVLIIFLVFCVVFFGGVCVDHLFSFLCCVFWWGQMINTDPTKKHNTEN
jgi:hypothetical protein